MLSLATHARCSLLFSITLLVSSSSIAGAAEPSAAKQAAVDAVDEQAGRLTAMSDKIWAYAETALRERRSSKLLADYAEENGFRVTRGVAGMPTAFIAEFGQGRPVIAVMGEYDALPGYFSEGDSRKESARSWSGGSRLRTQHVRRREPGLGVRRLG